MPQVMSEVLSSCGDHLCPVAGIGIEAEMGELE
jgi:hypothetical protein